MEQLLKNSISNQRITFIGNLNPIPLTLTSQIIVQQILLFFGEKNTYSLDSIKNTVLGPKLCTADSAEYRYS